MTGRRSAVFSLLNQHLNASQYIVHHHFEDRLYTLPSMGLKINCAELIAQHHALRLGTGTAQWHRKTVIADKIPALGDGRDTPRPPWLISRSAHSFEMSVARGMAYQ